MVFANTNQCVFVLEFAMVNKKIEFGNNAKNFKMRIIDFEFVFAKSKSIFETVN